MITEGVKGRHSNQKLNIAITAAMGPWLSKWGPPAAASPGNWLQMQILGPGPRPTKSETLMVVPGKLGQGK